MRIEVLWEQLLGKGLEHLILHQSENIEAESLAVGIVNGFPYRIQYQIVCDLDWNTQKTKVVELLSGKEVVLVKSGDGWLDENNYAIESLHGCADVDIMVTPFTNTLPIRRLELEQGDSKEIPVVYISVPDLCPSKLNQRYTCISQDKDGGTYKYENLSSGFTSEVKVDADGLVVEYPGIFKLAWKQLQTK